MSSDERHARAAALKFPSPSVIAKILVVLRLYAPSIEAEFAERVVAKGLWLEADQQVVKVSLGFLTMFLGVALA